MHYEALMHIAYTYNTQMCTLACMYKLFVHAVCVHVCSWAQTWYCLLSTNMAGCLTMRTFVSCAQALLYSNDCVQTMKTVAVKTSCSVDCFLLCYCSNFCARPDIKVLVPLLQIAYAIGIAEPVSIHIDTYSTGARSDSELLTIINNNFDLRPGIIVR